MLAVLALGAALRVAVVALDLNSLSDDRDAYLALAEGLWNDGQFGVGRPTAFRPPLYPMLLAPIAAVEDETLANILRGVLNVIFGCIAIWGTGSLARRLTTPPRASVAAALVAIDPLAVRYASLAMTESLCMAAMVAVVLAAQRAAARRTLRAASLLGLFVGVAALSRPTVLAAGLAVTVVVTLPRWRLFAVATALAAVPVAIWTVRNAVSVGTATPLTTHGGYTLALGNNEAFYDDILDQPWGTTWTDGQQRWIGREQEAMAELGLVTEGQRDRFHRERAVQTITRRPSEFIAACWLRFRRFWAPTPVSPQPSPIVAVVLIAYYGGLYLFAIVGSLRLLARDRRFALMLLAPIAVFAGVHLLYWANARMRLPIEPFLAVLAVSAIPKIAVAPVGRRDAAREDAT